MAIKSTSSTWSGTFAIAARRNLILSVYLVTFDRTDRGLGVSVDSFRITEQSVATRVAVQAILDDLKNP